MGVRTVRAKSAGARFGQRCVVRAAGARPMSPAPPPLQLPLQGGENQVRRPAGALPAADSVPRVPLAVPAGRLVVRGMRPARAEPAKLQ